MPFTKSIMPRFKGLYSDKPHVCVSSSVISPLSAAETNDFHFRRIFLV